MVSRNNENNETEIITSEPAPEERAVPTDRGLFKDIKWVYEIDDPSLLDTLRLSIRKWLDSIENFAQYVSRKLLRYGLIIEFSSNITPTKDGYTMVITMRLRGVKEPLLKKMWRYIRMQSAGWSWEGLQYRKMEKLAYKLLWKAVKDTDQELFGGEKVSV